jgi:hypothetical protein
VRGERTGQYARYVLLLSKSSFLPPSGPGGASIRRSRAGRSRFSYEAWLGVIALGVLFVVALTGYLLLFVRT